MHNTLDIPTRHRERDIYIKRETETKRQRERHTEAERKTERDREIGIESYTQPVLGGFNRPFDFQAFS